MGRDRGGGRCDERERERDGKAGEDGIHICI